METGSSAPSIDELISQTEKLAETLSKEPMCIGATFEKDGKGATSCISKERERKHKSMRRPFPKYDVKNMCTACAAYWFVQMAALELRNHKINSRL